jgi:hypothetical protein
LVGLYESARAHRKPRASGLDGQRAIHCRRGVAQSHRLLPGWDFEVQHFERSEVEHSRYVTLMPW